MKKEVNIRVLIKTVPHPNPQAAIDLIANILVNQLLKDKNDGGTSMYLAQAPSNKTIRGKAII
ncbi:MAG TPA: hypothetical protein DEF42_17975 [Desulfosporosinus sp.]|nr:hypothetical protein [Desulfosporosinus sp.]